MINIRCEELSTSSVPHCARLPPGCQHVPRNAMCADTIPCTDDICDVTRGRFITTFPLSLHVNLNSQNPYGVPSTDRPPSFFLEFYYFHYFSRMPQYSQQRFVRGRHRLLSQHVRCNQRRASLTLSPCRTARTVSLISHSPNVSVSRFLFVFVMSGKIGYFEPFNRLILIAQDDVFHRLLGGVPGVEL